MDHDGEDQYHETTGSSLELPRSPLSFQVIKVSASLAAQWGNADSNTILGVALPTTNHETGKRRVNNLIVSDGGKVQSLLLGPEASYSHTHFVQARKRQKLQPPFSDPHPSEGLSSNMRHPTSASDPPIGEFRSSSSVRVIGALSASRALTPSFDQAYRNKLKDRNEAIARPAHRTLVASASGYNRNLDGERHLFKFYNPNSTTAELGPPDYIKQRPIVASREANNMSNDQIREFVFKLFEAKNDVGVMLKEFQARVKVPQAQLRAALEEIGECVSRNGQRPKWYLKKEFTLSKTQSIQR